MIDGISPHITSITLTVTIVFFALVILWDTTLAMLKRKSISGFLPFFALGMVLTVYSGFIFFEIFLNQAWLILEFLIFFNLAWIFLRLRRKNAGNN